MQINNTFYLSFTSLWFVISLLGLLKISYFQMLQIPLLPLFFIAFIAPLLVTVLLRAHELSEKTKIATALVMMGLTPLLKSLAQQISLKFSLTPYPFIMSTNVDTTQVWYKQLLTTADFASSLLVLFFIYYGALNLIDYLKSKFIR
ncbi:hypothetical protein Noda2021_02120 [Candidatus Dependentiae bacterium Noda2021]|nr:hypothetical protein Noda2021_02120 [Candidatus Dependentiae bacterium Noda2021]